MSKTTKTPPVDRTKVPEDAIPKGKIMTLAEKDQSWRGTLALMEPQIRSAISEMTMRPDVIFQHAMNAMKYNPDLMACTTYSVCGCLMKACTLGLSLDPTLGEAFMIPFNNKNTGKKEAQFIIGYKGLMKRVIRTGKVKPPRTFLVHAGDYFAPVFDPFPSFKYVPWQFAVQQGLSTAKEEGDVIAAVFIAEHTASEHPYVEIMSRKELDKIQARSLSRTGGAWTTDPGEMQRKSVARRGCKWLSMDDPDTQQAIALDEMAELQIPQNMAALAFGDDSAVETAVEQGKAEIAKQEQSTAPEPTLPPDAELCAKVIEQIQARCKEMQGDNLSWPVFDEAIEDVAKKLNLDAGNIANWGLDALNLVWEKVKP